LTQSARPARKDIAAAPLADVKSPESAQEYDVPKDLDFAAVVIYNRDAGTVAAIARLQPEPACAVVPERSSLARQRPSQAPMICLTINEIAELNRTGTPPDTVDIASYRLAVQGEVDNPLSLSYEDLEKFPPTSQVVLLICGGVFADTAEWTGVPLSAVLEQARVRPDYRTIRWSRWTATGHILSGTGSNLKMSSSRTRSTGSHCPCYTVIRCARL
jgi:DMSO/TMAO reductase YedYZ molybdopterin-dependent catalytic subunit